MGDTPECLRPRPSCMAEMVEAKPKDKEGDDAPEQSIGSQLVREESIEENI